MCLRACGRTRGRADEDARHVARALLDDAEADHPAAVAGLLGHADIKTTFGYAHLAEGSVFDAANRVSRGLVDILDGGSMTERALDRFACTRGPTARARIRHPRHRSARLHVPFRLRHWEAPSARSHRELVQGYRPLPAAAAWTTLRGSARSCASAKARVRSTSRRMLLLIGCRSGEIRCLRWYEFKLDRLTLIDAKTGTRHVLLGEAARELLHDLRHAYASHAVMNGESLHVAGRLPSHRRASTKNRYVYLDDATLSQAAERVGLAITRKLRR